MDERTANQEAYLKRRLSEESSYILRVIIVGNMVVIYFSKLPILKKKELTCKINHKLSVFMDSDCCFKSEDRDLKAWTFIVTGKPLSDIHKEGD